MGIQGGSNKSHLPENWLPEKQEKRFPRHYQNLKARKPADKSKSLSSVWVYIAEMYRIYSMRTALCTFSLTEQILPIPLITKLFFILILIHIHTYSHIFWGEQKGRKLLSIGIFSVLISRWIRIRYFACSATALKYNKFSIFRRGLFLPARHCSFIRISSIPPEIRTKAAVTFTVLLRVFKFRINNKPLLI